MDITDILTWIVGIVQLPLLLAWLVIVLYLLFLTGSALIARLRMRSIDIEATTPLTRFTVLVPVHDEAPIIAACLDSLAKLDYPQRLWQLVVVADNCSDATADIATGKGATVYERHNTNEIGKGYALDWALARLFAQDDGWTGAVVIFDADTQVDPGFLRYMDAGLQNGSLALQGNYSLLDPFYNWRTALLYSALLLHNRLRPLARRGLGWTTLLKGNGMCFARSVLECFGWPAYGLAEDIEYTTLLLDEGIKVDAVSQATLYAEAPRTAQQANSQRMRWEGGRFELARRDGLRLLSEFADNLFQGEADFAMLDWALDLFIPPMAILVGLPLLLFAANLLLVVFGAPLAALAWLWLLLFVGGCVYVLGGLLISGAKARAYLYLLCAPFFMLWKARVYAAMLVGKAPRSWVRTGRTLD